MRRFFAVLGLTALGLCAVVDRARADDAHILLYNLNNGFLLDPDGTPHSWLGPNFTDPSAASGGALWICRSSGHNVSTGGAPVWVDEDVNIQIAALLPNTGGYTSLGSALVSDGTASHDVVPVLPEDGPNYGGYFSLTNVADHGEYSFPADPDLKSLPFQMFVWTGSATSYQEAINRGDSYVGFCQFSNPVGFGDDDGEGLTNMPAIRLSLAGPGSGSGDANGDGKVDINDLALVLANYDKTNMTLAQGDFNGDTKVDINDLSIVLTNYDKTFWSGAAVAGVPEPAAAVLLGIGAVVLMIFGLRRRAS